MRVDILTLFPGIFRGPLEESILGRAREKGLFEPHVHDLRRYTRDRHRTADDYSYGGGAGMVMKPEPIFAGVEAVHRIWGDGAGPVLLMSPQGEVFRQETARRLVQNERMLIICGRYEGVDERVRQHLVTEEISIGDYVLTGGELPALVVMDTLVRLIPGVLGESDSFKQDSFYSGRLDYPHYTRPRDYRGMGVPEVLLSGNHQEIARWREKQALKRTLIRRPDLLQKHPPDAGERELLEEIREELGMEGTDGEPA